MRYDDAVNAPSILKIAGETSLLSKFKARNDVFVILSPATPKGLAKHAINNGFSLIASSENYYTTPEEKELYRVAIGRRSATQSYPLHILSNEEWMKACHRILPEIDLLTALENRWWAFQQCNATRVHAARLIVPSRAMCKKAIRLGIDLNDPVYAARL